MLTTLLAISLLHWIVLVTPGANVLVVVNMAASGQRKAACFAAAGVTTVAGIWSALAVMGVGAIFGPAHFASLSAVRGWPVSVLCGRAPMA